jgi:hypothetical protein
MSDTFDKPVIGGLSTDPLVVDDPLTEDQEYVLKMAWVKLDDLFDSMEGGPHLKDRSKTGFDAAKSSLLMGYALAKINYGNPPLAFTPATFPYDTDSIVLSQSLVIQIIMHLIRSYTEQPTPQGTGYSRLSRKDYAQMWQSVLQTEQKEFEELVRIFRRKYLGLGHSAGLIRPRHGYGMGIQLGRNRARGWWY